MPPWLKVSPQSLGPFVKTDVGVLTAMPSGRTPSCIGVVAAWVSNTVRPIARKMIGAGTRRNASLGNGFALAMPMSPCKEAQVTEEPSLNEDSDEEIIGPFKNAEPFKCVRRLG